MLLHPRIQLLLPSLPFNPKHLIQIKILEREMKKAWKRIDRADEYRMAWRRQLPPQLAEKIL